MYRISSALAGAAMLLGANLAQADVLTLSNAQLDAVNAGGSVTLSPTGAGSFNFFGSANDGSNNGSFNGTGFHL